MSLAVFHAKKKRTQASIAQASLTYKKLKETATEKKEAIIERRIETDICGNTITTEIERSTTTIQTQRVSEQVKQSITNKVNQLKNMSISELANTTKHKKTIQEIIADLQLAKKETMIPQKQLLTKQLLQTYITWYGCAPCVIYTWKEIVNTGLSISPDDVVQIIIVKAMFFATRQTQLPQAVIDDDTRILLSNYNVADGILHVMLLNKDIPLNVRVHIHDVDTRLALIILYTDNDGKKEVLQEASTLGEMAIDEYDVLATHNDAWRLLRSSNMF